MLEMLMTGTNPRSGISPGSDTLVYGDTTLGYYGVVSQASFITGSALAAGIGLTEGVDYNTDVGWLKFASYGKVLFIPQKSLRHSLSWISIYNCGAVYGIDGYGRLNPGTPVTQNRTVTIAGRTYRVRLMTGATSDPIGTSGGEWNRLLYPLINGTWESNSPTSFYGVSSSTDSGSCTLCQEGGPANATITSTQIVRRGFTDYTTFGTSVMTTTGNRGWRPVLELIS